MCCALCCVLLCSSRMLFYSLHSTHFVVMFTFIIFLFFLASSDSGFHHTRNGPDFVGRTVPRKARHLPQGPRSVGTLARVGTVQNQRRPPPSRQSGLRDCHVHQSFRDWSRCFQSGRCVLFARKGWRWRAGGGRGIFHGRCPQAGSGERRAQGRSANGGRSPTQGSGRRSHDGGVPGCQIHSHFKRQATQDGLLKKTQVVAFYTQDRTKFVILCIDKVGDTNGVECTPVPATVNVARLTCSSRRMPRTFFLAPLKPIAVAYLHELLQYCTTNPLLYLLPTALDTCL